jgi:hypothetical protein
MIKTVKKHENSTIQENKQKRLAKFYKNSKNKPNNVDGPTNQVVTRVYGETSPMPIKPKIIVKNNMILFLRGHIRDSFENNRLYNFIFYLSNKYNLYIFIHTWNIISSNISWREIKTNKGLVTPSVIQNYFKHIKIKKIIIDTDNNIELNGITEGRIKTTLMPIKGWKYMWYGMNRLSEYILDNLKVHNLTENTYTLNTRFDYFNNSTISQYIENPDKLTNYNFMNTIFDFKTEYINFLINPPHFFGIDNLYFGKFYKIYYTIKLFHIKLDNIIDCFDYIYAQENLVKLIQPYINSHCDNNNIYQTNYVMQNIENVLISMKKTYIDSIKNNYIQLNNDVIVQYIQNN